MRKRNKYKSIMLTGVVLSGVSLGSLVCVNKITKGDKLEEENAILRAELKEADAKLINSRIEKLKEINKENTKLVIFESNKAKYSKTIQDKSWFPIPVTIDTKYSYKVTIDLSKAQIVTIKDTTYVEINYEDIKLDTISIDIPKIDADVNFINQFKSKTLEKLTDRLLKIANKEINNLIVDDFNSKTDIFKSNLNNKLNDIYSDMDVYTKYIKDVKEVNYDK